MAMNGPTCTRYKWADDVVLLAFEGHIDMDTAVDFRTNLLDAVNDKPRGVAVDLRDIGYMDSSGVAVMVEMLRWCQKGGIEFCVVEPSAAVKRALEVMHVANALPMVGSIPDARERFVRAGMLAPVPAESSASRSTESGNSVPPVAES